MHPDRSSAMDMGAYGEEEAARFLESQGFEIIERNWRYRRLEIDLIAWDEDVMVFIEVKTRSWNSYYAPERAVGKSKWDTLARAAGIYMKQSGHEWEVRFDVISVQVYPDGQTVIRQFKDVFFPGRY